ncbi:alpha/beta fold hydrolase [Planococcus lenghuensis]|uniref:Alpha/beta hydrolase n=1 Tax=Planococcus lenghuensis TaxID=2213202 RepID=A0A1Q2L572_9BACL|nr:alpha/beta hydrolase [Planococcus lenghuensis]AQQ55551.1 alpha/beta hydrolase [Planococcus lenghuensis]
MKQGKMVKIRGKDMYVELYGEEHEEAILYLHGGPGESCYDFSFHQAERLSTRFKVVAIDQRGVCRSEEIKENELFALQDLIEDCEELRKHLNVEKWSLIGHSFGGFLSVLYSSLYPGSIHKVILECPTFDFSLSSKSLLQKTARLSEAIGNFEIAEKCLKLANTAEQVSSKELLDKYLEYSDTLGEERMAIYRHNQNHPTDYALYSEEEWEAFYDKSEIHFDMLRAEGEIYQSLLPLLENIKVPMLLITAEYDPVTCGEQIRTFTESAENGEVVHFSDCGHSPHYENPDRFCNEVLQFLHSELFSQTSGNN